MPTSPDTSVSVSIVAVKDASASIVYGLHEVFAGVGTIWTLITGEQVRARQIRSSIVAETMDPVTTELGTIIAPTSQFSNVPYSDIVIVPDLAVEAWEAPVGRWPEAVAWIRKQHDAGAVVCSVCTGTLMLADAGLFEEHEATTHWCIAQCFARHFPHVRLRTGAVLLPVGPEHRILSTGGSASWEDLALYLIARFCGEDEARRIAKVFLFGDRSAGQSPYASFVRPPNHSDKVIEAAQQWIADHYDIPNPVKEMTDRSGLEPQTFKRRFKKATGYAPLEYVQTLRIEEAKHVLETTDVAIETIAEDTGYDDAGSFRRLFKRVTGLTPRDYRRRFSSIGTLSERRA